MPLAGEKDDVALPGHPDGFGDRFSAAADLDRVRGARENLAADLGGILAARIVVGDDNDIGKARGHGAHFRPLALVTVAAGAEDGDQTFADVRAERCDRRHKRVCGMRVINVDRRSRAADDRALQPSANGGKPLHRGEDAFEASACRHG